MTREDAESLLSIIALFFAFVAVMVVISHLSGPSGGDLGLSMPYRLTPG